MKTLLVYYSDDDTIRSLCEKSASGNTDIMELRELSGTSPLRRKVDAIRGAYTKLGSCDKNVSDYETVLLVSDGRCGGVYPAMNTFLRDTDLRFKNVVCLIFGTGTLAARATDALRMRVSLSGGTAGYVVNIPVKQFKRDEEDILFYVRHKLSV